MIEYRFAQPQDMPLIIDFIDLVFSQQKVPHDFEKLIPKAYGEGRDLSRTHAIALDEGRVVGCVACYPFLQTMGGYTLRCEYLGSVSVHRHARGAGIMKKLMQIQLDRARAEGVDLLALGGQRQRYEYHGFVPTGGMYRYSFTTSNARHALADVDISGLCFVPLTNEDPEAVRYCWTLYQQQPVCGARTPEDFVVTAQTFLSCPWLVLLNGQKAGYLISSRNDASVTELVMEDPALVPAVLKAWLPARGLRSIGVEAAPYNKPLNRTLARFAEGFSLEENGMLLCLNFPKVAAACMSLKNSVSPLNDGQLVLSIEGGDAFRLAVKDGQVCAEPVTGPADVTLSAKEAMHLLFSHNRFYAPEVDCAIPDGWFPLPQCIASPDHF